MPEDPERDEGDEESPDSPASESDSSASSGDSAAEETDDDAPAEESPTDEPDRDADSDEAADESQEGEDGAGDDTEEEDGEGTETDGDDAEGEDGEGDEPNGDDDAVDVDAEGDVADESDTTDSDSAGATEPVPEPDLSAEAAASDDDSDREPPDDEYVDEEPYIEEFTVPEMEMDAAEEREIERAADDDEVDSEAGSARTLPEDEDGVGVDVPQQPLEDEEADDGLWGDGPESDQEMPLADHIEEMMRRLSVVFLVAGAVALTLLGLGEAFEPLPTAVELIDALWNNAIPGAPEMADRRPRLYGPLELILTKLKVTALAGLLIGLPVFVYETYLFMRPGLYRHERRYYLAAVPTSLILGTIGMSFAHFVIIPAIMDYFTVYTQENVASVAYGLAETFNLILILMGYMAVVFQIPLFIMLAIMMGLTTRLWLEDKRLLFWGGFLTVAFIVNPDPTGMTPFIIAATMIVLYEGTLALLRWTGN
jgi:sec-independent protein translocase protein TatC